MVKDPPSKAGYVGLIPGQRTKIPHTMGQLSSCATMKTQHSQIKIKQSKKVITASLTSQSIPPPNSEVIVVMNFYTMVHDPNSRQRFQLGRRTSCVWG